VEADGDQEEAAMTGVTRPAVIDLRAGRTGARPRHLPAGRTLHLVDLENLAGGSAADRATVDDAFVRYERVVRFGEGDHRIVACGRRLAYAAKDRWRGALVKAAHGIDGADRVLLAEASPDFVRRRYDRVVVASGDHGFVPLVVALDRFGVEVCVVSRHDALARRLREAAPVVWYLDDELVPAA
jgi:hypothetical protein